MILGAVRRQQDAQVNNTSDNNKDDKDTNLQISSDIKTQDDDDDKNSSDDASDVNNEPLEQLPPTAGEKEDLEPRVDWIRRATHRNR